MSEQVTAFSKSFHGALEQRETDHLLFARSVDGVPVQSFPARERSEAPAQRLAALRLFRSALVDFAARPDLDGTGGLRIIQPEDGEDADVMLDMAFDLPASDLGGYCAAALVRFGLHRNRLGGVDPDALYDHQVLLMAVEDLTDGQVSLFRAMLSCPRPCEESHLASSDLRSDVEAVRQRLWREQVYEHLVHQVVDDPAVLSR